MFHRRVLVYECAYEEGPDEFSNPRNDMTSGTLRDQCKSSYLPEELMVVFWGVGIHRKALFAGESLICNKDREGKGRGKSRGVMLVIPELQLSTNASGRMTLVRVGDEVVEPKLSHLARKIDEKSHIW